MGETVFDIARRTVLALLNFSPEELSVTSGNRYGDGVVGVFLRLLDLSDDEILAVVAVIMGETLASGSMAVAALGEHLSVDMAQWWTADDAFFDLLRDREVLTQIVREVAGETIAVANQKEKTKVSKAIIRDHLNGANGRAKRESWVPRWLAFPATAYTARGSVGTVAAHDPVHAAGQEQAQVICEEERLAA